VSDDLVQVRFRKADTTILPNWRGSDVGADDDAQLGESPADVVAMLGFDPADADADQDDKQSQEQVGYVGPGRDRPRGQRCEKCTMFVRAAEDASDPGTCTAVQDKIDPAGWCEIFEAK